jgi:hypothetical protein
VAVTPPRGERASRTSRSWGRGRGPPPPDHEGAEPLGGVVAGHRVAGQAPVHRGQLPVGHAQAAVGDLEDVGGPELPPADPHPGLGRGEGDGVVHQLGQEVGQVVGGLPGDQQVARDGKVDPGRVGVVADGGGGHLGQRDGLALGLTGPPGPPGPCQGQPQQDHRASGQEDGRAPRPAHGGLGELRRLLHGPHHSLAMKQVGGIRPQLPVKRHARRRPDAPGGWRTAGGPELADHGHGPPQGAGHVRRHRHRPPGHGVSDEHGVWP